MSNNEYCYNCDQEVEYEIKEECISMVIKNTSFEFTGKVAFCKQCGEEIYIAELNDENIKKANEEYRKKEGIIQISEIEELLEKYDIGQKPLAKLLGWSEVTIVRYLQGLTPSKEYSDRLKELKNPYKIQTLYLENGNVLTDIAKKKLETSIQKLFNPQRNNDEADAMHVAKYFLTKVDMESQDLITHLQLQKLVYYAQAWALTFLGRPLFQNQFEAWLHGPVVRELYGEYKQFGYNPIPKVAFFDEDFFTNEEKNILEMIWKVYGKYTARYLENLTHNEDPWKVTRGECGVNEKCEDIIPRDLMREYYTDIKNRYNIKSTNDLNDYVANMKID